MKKAADILELETLLERKPRQLSGGQRQRVAMGRAIVREPAVFLFDEPLSNLDAKLRVQMRFEIQKLHRRLGTTALYVTHDQVEAMTLAQRMIVMNAGRAEQIGTPMEVYEHPATQFVAGFIGSPSMNFVTGKVQGNGKVALAHGGVAMTTSGAAAETGRDVVVGIRPEHLMPSSAGDAVLSGTVEMVEQLGADMLIHVAHGPQLILARVAQGDLAGHRLDDALPGVARRVFLFDAAQGGRLRVTARRLAVSALVAHRGAGKLAPENTLAALRLGHAHGYRMAEFDVKLSADGVAFLLHDATLERTTDGSGRADALHLARALAARRRRVAFARVRRRAAADARCGGALLPRQRHGRQHRDQAHARARARDRRGGGDRRRDALAPRGRAAAAVVVLGGRARGRTARPCLRCRAPDLCDRCCRTGGALYSARLHRARREAHAARREGDRRRARRGPARRRVDRQRSGARRRAGHAGASTC